jgi:hypothetical protein
MRPVRDILVDRRDFFTAIARYVLLGVLGVLGYFGARSSKLPDQNCIRKSLCNGCVQFIDCGLPAALSRKQSGTSTRV